MNSGNHKYRNLSPDEYDQLFSNFLIDSWSFSKISSFSRNEKAFEMSYIYRVPPKLSASTIAGQAYHLSLDYYFESLKNKEEKDLVELQKIAFEFIENQRANIWKIQKTTPTIDACKEKAYKLSVSLLENFLREKQVYEFKEILFIERYFDEFLNINGVDIPLPCHAKVDLIAKTHDDKIVVIDHKSKATFSDEKELAFGIGKQAITYFNCVESALKIKVDEVWFVENKYSNNRNGKPQLNCFKVEMSEDTIKLYEALVYEPLKRMLEAVSDPDYVYLINENDNFIDKAEIHEFWSKTMISEVEDFNIPESKKEIISNRLKKIRDASIGSINPSVIKKFRNNASEFIQYNLSDKDMTKQEKIEHILRTLGIIARVDHTFSGYSNDTFLLSVSAGTSLSKIYKYKLDIANALDVSSIRINKQLFVYEGKSYISIESSKKRDKDLIFDKSYLEGLKIPIGVDNFDKCIYWDLQNQSTPHVLMCGATGSGKSVSIESIIHYAIEAKIQNIVVFDPKFEFQTLKANSNIEVYNDIEDIENKMEQLIVKMNELVKSGSEQKTLIVFDEFADAVSASKKGQELKVYEDQVVGLYQNGSPKMKRIHVSTKKALEENLKIILQKGRSSGFRVLAATQRASVKVITGDAKVNFPVQICFRVPKEIDSKVVLGESGAESLSGKGDGLINSPEYLDLVRFQGFYKG
ncbi:DNA translocase FtsK [Aquimarina macrocephali]|uniref:DNA translocase FtsK n=1 Tax=Aquimarina macrocephali TaxID=666563 RepID=UPI003F67B3FB